MPTLGPDRMPPLALGAMTPAQRQAHDAIASGPRGTAEGPFAPMLRSPGLTERLQRVGEYLRYSGAMSQRLRELAILTTARHWDQAYEWFIHAPIALTSGLPRPVLADLANGATPSTAAADEATVYAFCTEVHRAKGVSDPTYAAALALLGEEGVVDLLGICGYYATLAMIMNAARTPVPPGQTAFAIPAGD